MKAISFLGATQAYDTTYYLPDSRTHTAPFFPAALVRFYPVDTLLVFVTAGARSTHYDHLHALAEDFVPSILPVDIPDGRDEAELWQIFAAVADAVAPQDRVIFDITHGFRSLPFLSFLAAAYLRAVKRVTLEAVLYGALEAGDRSVTPARAPVFDLSRFVTLLDWLTAADRFVRFGDARDLAGMLRDPGATPVHLAAAAGDRQAQQMAGALKGAATAMERVALPLRLTRPLETMEAAATFDQALAAAQSTFSQWAPPLALVADEVRAAYAPFGLAEPLSAESLYQSLAVQRKLIEWYLEKEQILQAATLGQEWLISWVMGWLGELPLDNQMKRQQISSMLGAEAKRLREERARCKSSGDALSFIVERLDSVPEPTRTLDLFTQLGQVRNDLNHAGLRKGRMAAAALASRTRELCLQLVDLPLPGVPLDTAAEPDLPTGQE
jgi:CRISPR-associated DxTHG motif protein